MENLIRAMSATPITLPAPNDDFADALAKTPLFEGLSAAIVKSICKCADYRRYELGQTVLSQGQYDGGEFFVLLAGRMRISNVNAKTGAMLIEEFGPDDVFGLEFALSGDPDETLQRFSATAEDNLAVVAIEAVAFRTLAAQRPSLMRNVAVYLAKSLSAHRFRSMIAEAAPEQRIFAALLRFVERDGVSGAWRVPRMPKHRELADAAGVEESAAACAVAALIQEGVARRDYPGLIVADMDRLTKLAG